MFYSFLLNFNANKKPCQIRKGFYKYKNLRDLTLFLKKKLCRFVFLAFLFVSCSNSEVERNPYLQEYRFQFQINLNLPEYDDLRFAGGSLLIPQIGHKGVLVFNLNGSDYFAWDASCPNHAPNTCSQTQLNGVLTECPCDSFQYSLATGQLLNPPEDSGQLYPLLFYRAETRGNAVVISN
jgi:nitrite reductase/ring-hydroxylating ferredoxin subunit